MGTMTLLEREAEEWCLSDDIDDNVIMLDTDNMILMMTLFEKCGSGANFDDTDDRVVMDKGTK